MHLPPPRQLLRLLLQALGVLCSRLAVLGLWGPLRRRVSPSSAPEPPAALRPPVPLSVNYHFTRQCNYKCGFCFHTAKTSFVLPLQVAKRGLRLLKEAGKGACPLPGSSGGDGRGASGGRDGAHRPSEISWRAPDRLYLYCSKLLHASKELKRADPYLEKCSWEYLDILAVSCDSFNEEVNVLIGRGQGKKNHVENLEKLKTWCQKYNVAFKINSVINRFNVEEDMNEKIKALNPVRWKMRFLNCVNGRKEPSRSILDVGVKNAIQRSGFDEKMFLKRGGKYVWSKRDMALQW
ncbi:PREDICTED: radical S-adenosyl methionine domain-containing protein 2 [Thamnophis sirtalis]|uniref:Radical S-adenosyl methionine domain-containing protein 2 n=1 Tax=Thamnophis sirtalis TaxID=35019 RepID=A0A6I9YVP2_9SAUR|nr:PREDICTED: radical S-adenosyl methionine domain-containing protein 2 [Thamnophis sirtalis]